MYVHIGPEPRKMPFWEHMGTGQAHPHVGVSFDRISDPVTRRYSNSPKCVKSLQGYFKGPGAHVLLLEVFLRFDPSRRSQGYRFMSSPGLRLQVTKHIFFHSAYPPGYRLQMTLQYNTWKAFNGY